MPFYLIGAVLAGRTPPAQVWPKLANIESTRSTWDPELMNKPQANARPTTLGNPNARQASKATIASLGHRGTLVGLCRRQTPFRTRSSADRPAGPQFGLPPGSPRSPFWPISIRNRHFMAASPRARRTVASSAWA